MRALSDGAFRVDAEVLGGGGVDVLGDLDRGIGDDRLGVHPQVHELLRREVLDELDVGGQPRPAGAAIAASRRFSGRIRRATGVVSAPASAG